MANNIVQGFAQSHRTPLTISAIAHVVLFALLGSSMIVIPRQPMPQLAIQATIVSDKLTTKVKETDQIAKAEEAAELQKRGDSQRRVDQQEAETKKAEQQRQVQEKRQVEEKKKAETEQLRLKNEAAAADKKRKIEADAAEKKRKADAATAEKRKQDEAAKVKREQEQREAAAKAKAEADKREQARRQSELLASMEAEEALFAAQQSGELNRYLALIQQKVERNWVRPPSAVAGLECEVAVAQLPTGDVVDARTVSCNGDDAVKRSVENAVRRSSPLPLPDNRALFERNLRFVFRPQQ